MLFDLTVAVWRDGTFMAQDEFPALSSHSACEGKAVEYHREALQKYGKCTTYGYIQDTEGLDDQLEFVASKDGSVAYLD